MEREYGVGRFPPCHFLYCILVPPHPVVWSQFHPSCHVPSRTLLLYRPVSFILRPVPSRSPFTSRHDPIRLNPIHPDPTRSAPTQSIPTRPHPSRAEQSRSVPFSPETREGFGSDSSPLVSASPTCWFHIPTYFPYCHAHCSFTSSCVYLFYFSRFFLNQS